MKKRLIKALAIYLSLAMMFSTLLVPEMLTFAIDSVYNATLLNYDKIAANSSSFGAVANPIDTELSGVPAYSYTHGWNAGPFNNTNYQISVRNLAGDALNEGITPDGETISFKKYIDKEGNLHEFDSTGEAADGTKLDKTNRRLVCSANTSYNNPISGYLAYFEKTDAVMFYVKMPMTAPETEWLFQMRCAAVDKVTDGGKEVIYPKHENYDYIQIKKGAKIQLLPNGNTEWMQYKTNPSNIDSRLGHIVFPAGFEGWVRIPHDATLYKDGLSRYIDTILFRPMNLGGKYTDGGVTYGSFMFVDDGANAAYKVKVDGTDYSLIKDKPHNPITLLNVSDVKDAAIVDNENAINGGYTYNIPANEATFEFADTLNTLDSNGGLMLYVKQPLTGAGRLAVTLNNTYGLKNGEEIMTLNRGETNWSAGTVEENQINLPVGFEGYILIKTAALGGAAGKKITSAKFTSLTEGLNVGSVMLSADTVDSLFVSVAGSGVYNILLKEQYYNAELLGTADSAVNQFETENYYEISAKKDDPNFAAGVGGSYSYELSAGNAANGSVETDVKLPEVEFAAYSGTRVVSVQTSSLSANTASNFAWGKDNGTDKIAISTPIGYVPGVEMKGANATESVVANNNGGSQAAKFAISLNVTNFKVNTEGSFMFYVKHTGTKAVKTAMSLSLKYGENTNKMFHLQKEKTYYTFDVTKGKWEQQTGGAVTGKGATLGDITIPGNFAGWVRIPYTSFAYGVNGEAVPNQAICNNLSVFPANLGGDAGSIEMGAFSVLNEKNNLYYVNFDGTNKLGLCDFQGEAGKPLEAERLMNALDPYTATNTSKVKAFGSPNEFTSNFTTVSTPMGNTSGVTIAVNSSSTSSYVSGGVFSFPNNNPGGTKVQFGLETDTFTLNKNGSYMFYVDHSNSTMPITAAVGLVANSGGWYFAARGKEYKILDCSTGKWSTKTATTVSGVDQGFIEFPAGFKGWIKIPALSTKRGNDMFNADFMDPRYLVIDMTALGGDYGTLKIGGIQVVEEGGDMSLTKDATGSKQPLFDISLISTPKLNITMSEFLGDKVFTTNSPANGAYSTVNLNSKAVLKSDEAFMFYVEQNGNVSSALRVDLGESGYSMKIGSKFVTYNVASQSWESAEAADDGRVILDAGFSGWVRIPYESFVNAEGKAPTNNIEFENINVLPYALGGKYGNIKFGSFMITNNGAQDLSTMRVNKGDEVAVGPKKSYEGSEVNILEMLPSGDNARNIDIEITRKTPIVSYTNGTSKKYTAYTMKSSDGDLIMTLESAVEIALSQAISITKTDGLLFYVNLNGSGTNNILFGGEMTLAESGAYAILNSGTDAVWETKASAGSKLELPAGFEGWVRVPFASLSAKPARLSKFIFGLENLSESGIEFGNFIVTDNGNYDRTDLYIGGAIEPETLLNPDYNSGYKLDGALTTDSDSGNKITVTSAGTDMWQIASTNGEFELASPTTRTPRTKFTISEDYRSKPATEGGLMFYVELPSGAGNKLYLEIKADNSAIINEGLTYSFLADGNNYWTESAANWRQEILLPEGFKGWVRIDSTSMKNASTTFNGNIKEICMSWRRLGGNFGSPKIGKFILLDSSADSGKLVIKNVGETNIYGSNGPKTYSRNDIGIWESVTSVYSGYEIGDSMEIQTRTDTTKEDEASSEYKSNVIDDIPDANDTDNNYDTPFGNKGMEFTSTNAVVLHGDQYPRNEIPAPISLKGTKGIILYMNVPDKYDAEGNKVDSKFFFQVATNDGNSYTIKYYNTVAILEDGTENWRNIFNEAANVGERQKICLPSGFEGYIYIPYSALQTYKNATGGGISLTEHDVIRRLNFGIGSWGGSDEDGNLIQEAKAYIGGIWLSKNGVLSGNGAYVDGSDTVRNVFTGETLNADDVAYSEFDPPAILNDIFETIPDGTTPDHSLFEDSVTGHSFTVGWDKYPGADGYRLDVYELAPYAYEITLYKFLGSHYVGADEIMLTVNDLIPNRFYTVVITALRNGEGIARYAPSSVYTQMEIIGDMLGENTDIYKHPWYTDDENSSGEDEYEYYYEYEYDYGDGTGEPEYITEVVKKKVKRRVLKGGFRIWQIIVIIVAAVIVAAGVVILLIYFKRKKRKNVPFIENVSGGGDE